jgi:Ca-activated chloride channel homolog
MFGFSGARNKGNFNHSLSTGNTPDESSITFEGTFSEYYFDDGAKKLKETCYAHYTTASNVQDIFTQKKENFISVSLHSIFDGLNHREPLNLLVILDISGSMASYFDKKSEKCKMDTAKDVLKEVIKVMSPDENLGIILFDHKVEVLQSIKKVSKINLDELLDSVEKIKPRGSTDMGIAMKTGVQMMKDHLNIHGDKTKSMSHRIIFLTDAMPNVGMEKNDLQSLTKSASMDKVFTTFIGIGLDFDANLVDELTKADGANYFSVHSKDDFMKVLKDDFNYIVTTIALNSYLLVESEHFEIDEAYGTPFKKETTSTTIKLGSSTASDVNEKGTKGGMILIKLKERELKSSLNPSKSLKLTLFYEDLLGKKYQFTQNVELNESSEFENNCVRKLIALTKFVQISKEMLKKKKSSKLEESDENKLTQFIKYFNEEVEAIGDESLSKEIESLNQLKYNSDGIEKMETPQDQVKKRPYVMM